MRTNIQSFKRAGARGLILMASLVVLQSTPQAAVGAFSEPHTVFYGKVLGTASEQPFLIQEGQLVWTIQRSDGSSTTLRTTLYPFHDGQFTYQLQVPHSVLALGLESSPDGIPLSPTPDTHMHALVILDGQRVTLLGPAGSTFTTRQLLRTATHRLDLGIAREALDTDGDGIPDWWEDLHGLDKQDPSDATLDLTDDGLSVLDAYRRGLDPTRNALAPAILTEEQIVYPAGSTALLLDTADLDSEADQITYTLLSLQLAGTLTLRNAQENPADPDQVLTVGDTFTHSDLLAGRVIYDHDDSEAEPGSFEVEVRDEKPEHPADAATIRLLAFRPSESPPPEMPTLEARRHAAGALASAGFVILDATGLPVEAEVANPSAGLDPAELIDYQAAYGEDRPYVFIGGGNDVAILGGHRDDVLIVTTSGGKATGGAGADRFVFESFDRGRVTITDFIPGDGDVVDFSGLDVPTGARAQDFLRIVGVVDGVELQVGLQGDGSSYTNLAVALPGLSLVDADLYDLVSTGALVIGGLRLNPIVSVVASQPQAFQSGPTPGRFTVHRAGDLTQALTVTLSLSGTASNGVDYEWIGPSLYFPAGVAARDITLMPYMTGYQGPAKIAHIRLEPDAGYELGVAADAMVTIENLVPLLELEVIEPVAVMVDEVAGVFLIRRRDVTTGETDVRLTFAGTAVAGIDYETLPSVVTFTAGQTVKRFDVVPIYTVEGSGTVKTLLVTVVPDSDYAIKLDRGTVSVEIDQTGVPVMGPAFGQILETRQPIFSWPPVAGATWYQLWIHRNGATHAQPWVQGATQWSPATDLPSGNYTWWVRGWNAVAGGMPWSGAAHFEIPTAQPGPIAQYAPSGVQPSRDIWFRWDQTDRRATWFKLWVSHPTGGTWLDQWVEASADAAASVLRQNHPGGTSTWWLRGWGPDGHGPWTGPIAFETPDPAPTKPALLSPLGLTTSPVTLTYESAQAEWFRIYISRDGARVVDAWTQSTSFDAGALPSGTYAWWVGAWNPEASATIWSDRQEFLVP